MAKALQDLGGSPCYGPRVCEVEGHRVRLVCLHLVKCDRSQTHLQNDGLACSSSWGQPSVKDRLQRFPEECGLPVMLTPDLGSTVGRGHRRGEQCPLRPGPAGRCTLSHVTELLCLSGQVSLFTKHFYALLCVQKSKIAV